MGTLLVWCSIGLTQPGLDLRDSALLALQCLLQAQLQQPDDPLRLLFVALVFSRHQPADSSALGSSDFYIVLEIQYASSVFGLALKS
jgi:hypothetical protein